MKEYNSVGSKILRFALAGALVGLVFGNIEYLIDSQTGDEDAYIPLQIRAMCIGVIVGALAMFVELKLRVRFRQRAFLYLVLVRALVYTAIISVSLIVVNAIWYTIKDGQVVDQLERYVGGDRMFVINLLTVFAALVVIGSLDQVNSLHRKGELWNFILGRYHEPSKEERIFCFIDLKGSTTLTERLGDLKYASFLRDYYSDISDAIRSTKAVVYQYVGDEIVLTWSMGEGIKHLRCLNCLHSMHQTLASRSEYYMSRYGHTPDFRAGVHAGECVVTWVGEVKREIVYVGDVLNTTARIQESCKTYETDVLISSSLLAKLSVSDEITTQFIDSIMLRGKATQVELHGVRFG